MPALLRSTPRSGWTAFPRNYKVQASLRAIRRRNRTTRSTDGTRLGAPLGRVGSDARKRAVEECHAISANVGNRILELIVK